MTFAGHVCESIICLLYPNRQKRKRYLLKREKRKRHSKETGNNDTGFNGRRIFYPPRENHEAGKKEEGKKKAVKSDREIENGKSGKGNSSYTKVGIVKFQGFCVSVTSYFHQFVAVLMM